MAAEFQTCSTAWPPHHSTQAQSLVCLIGFALLSLLLVALAALDAEHFWLPDVLTYPGIALGFIFALLRAWSGFIPKCALNLSAPLAFGAAAVHCLVAICAAGGLILIIRLAYWLIRRQEGMGLGDAKLMAMLGAWLGLIGTIESFAIAVFAASAAAGIALLLQAIRKNKQSGEWSTMPLPLGTFLCLAAMVEIFYPNWFWNALTAGYPGR
jgi:leader peptidase (prepilin peptidase) / N-methyltransferase